MYEKPAVHTVRLLERSEWLALPTETTLFTMKRHLRQVAHLNCDEILKTVDCDELFASLP